MLISAMRCGTLHTAYHLLCYIEVTCCRHCTRAVAFLIYGANIFLFVLAAITFISESADCTCLLEYRRGAVRRAGLICDGDCRHLLPL